MIPYPDIAPATDASAKSKVEAPEIDPSKAAVEIGDGDVVRPKRQTGGTSSWPRQPHSPNRSINNPGPTWPEGISSRRSGAASRTSRWRVASSIRPSCSIWFSGRVLSWRLSITMEAAFCVETLEDAMARLGKPEIFNTDRVLSTERTRHDAPRDLSVRGVLFASLTLPGQLPDHRCRSRPRLCARPP